MFTKIKSTPVVGWIMVVCCLSVFASNAAAQRVAPSLGTGSFEVLMFSDYFCPPYKRIDTKAEPLLKELLATGKVKITFIDVPVHQATPIYARYYLYAANAGADKEEIFRVRKILFQGAQEKRIPTKEALVSYLKEQKIVWTAYDEKPVFLVLSQMIKQHKIDNTPTCVIRYSLTDEKKYVGTEEIWNGLTQLKLQVTIGKK